MLPDLDLWTYFHLSDKHLFKVVSKRNLLIVQSEGVTVPDPYDLHPLPTPAIGPF